MPRKSKLLGNVGLTGDLELDMKLAALTKTKARAAVRKASREASKRVATLAKTLVPRRSGQLQRSIKVRALKRSRVNLDRPGTRVVTGKDTGKFPDVYYGPMVEFGTKKMRAQPFLKPALQQSKSVIIATMTAKLREILK